MPSQRREPPLLRASTRRPRGPACARESSRASAPPGSTREKSARPARAAARPRVRGVIEPVVVAAGFDLEDVSLSRAGRRHVVRVLVDADGGISLDDVAVVSREISQALDTAEETGGEVLAGEYQLEVGSPGVDRPLTLPRHWRRNVGRLVAVNGLTGRIVAADDEGIVLDGREIAYADLGPGKVQIEFKRMDEAVFDGDDTDDDTDDEDDLGEGEE